METPSYPNTPDTLDPLVDPYFKDEPKAPAPFAQPGFCSLPDGPTVEPTPQFSTIPGANGHFLPDEGYRDWQGNPDPWRLGDYVQIPFTFGSDYEDMREK